MVETKELVVPGTPRSHQGTSKGLRDWRTLIIDAVKNDIGEDAQPIQFADLSIHIFHFCPEWGDTDGDLDNIANQSSTRCVRAAE
jgi:hypothetical protein